MQYPIAHWSYSSMIEFLRNRLSFKKKYILKIQDNKTGPSAVVGKAYHKALESFYGGQKNRNVAFEVGMAQIENTPDQWIEYGKTGSREKILASYAQAMEFYWQEEPEFHEVLAVEKSLTHFIDVNGTDLSLPAKAIVDLVTRNEKKELEIVDHKVVKEYTDAEVDSGERMIQAMFNYHTVKKEFGEAPKRMIFNELKPSKNKDGSPQLQSYIIEFDKHQDFFGIFHQLYNDCTKEVSREDCLFLPNITDMYSGQQSFEDYRNQIITVEAVVVNHKTEHKTYVEKKFVDSAPLAEENRFLTPEEKIRTKLQEFGLPTKIEATHVGANITLYTLKPGRGVKMSTLENHAKDIALALEAKTIRVEAPIPGTNLVGVEVPNTERTTVEFSPDLPGLEAGTLNIPIGVDVYGKPIIKSLESMPHLLIAGTTGAGKSVMINVLIKSLVAQNTPETLQLILIDPKRVELAQFRDLPHLKTKIIYDDVKATITMRWLVDQMEERYSILESAGYRTIIEYNKSEVTKMPRMVVVIDEFADLVLQTMDEENDGPSMERCIVRLTQKARAVGIHLVLGTQRPSVDVITGLIKANLPTRIAFMTASRVDSQVILDQPGAEELIGRGDMLFLDPHERGLKRLQGYYS